MLAKAGSSNNRAKPLQILAKMPLIDAVCYWPSLHKRSWGSWRHPWGPLGGSRVSEALPRQPLPSRRYNTTTLWAYSLATVILVSNAMPGGGYEVFGVRRRDAPDQRLQRGNNTLRN
jgi:hypothetical protein